MRIFLAGATGAIGQHLVPALVAAGHSVVAMIRSQSKTDLVGLMGASPVIADAFDASAVLAAVRQAEPEIVIHQLTAIPPNANFRTFDRDFALTNRLRREGLNNLLAAARSAGASRFIAQSFVGWTYARQGGPVKTEEDPLDPHASRAMRTTLDTIRSLETTVLETTDLECLALRYGILYGPGSSIARDGGYLVKLVRRRRVALIRPRTGILAVIPPVRVAPATERALDHGAPGVYNIVDDDPAAVIQWLPVPADARGAEP